MKRLLIITGFESSGSVFAARIAALVTNKCQEFDDWDGLGWIGAKGDDLVIVHRSMPYGRRPKKWFDDLIAETDGMEEYARSYVICTRDLTIAKLSRISRFKGRYAAYEHDDSIAKKIFSDLLESEKTFVLSFETAVALGDAYYRKFYDWLGVESDFSPPVFDANAPYIRGRASGGFLNRLWRIGSGRKRISR